MLKKIRLSSKITVISLAFLLLFLANLKFQQWRNQAAIEHEKQNLQQQVDALQKKNADLNDSLSYIGSPEFKERVARQQLNLKKDGEVVFGFSDPAAQAVNDPKASQPAMPNYEKWINYFFGEN